MIKEFKNNAKGLTKIKITGREDAERFMAQNPETYIIVSDGSRFVFGGVFHKDKWWGTEDITRAKTEDTLAEFINGLTFRENRPYGAYFQEIKGWWSIFFGVNAIKRNYYFVFSTKDTVIQELKIT